MFNIKKQINKLYITSILANLSITGAWVAILAARGFSLIKIGFAETVFHITSLIFEIPSGVFADVFGRKRMLVISHFMTIIGNVIMVLNDSFVTVCFSFVFFALGYNFSSGSDDALAYDSLKSVNQESRYEKYSSNQLIIYRIGNAFSTLCAGVALMLGYKTAYTISALTDIAALMFIFTLKEIRVNADEAKLMSSIIRCFADSFIFLRNEKKAVALMMCNSAVGAIDILLLFFLQAKLLGAGLKDFALGVALFAMELGGMLGAKLILKFNHIRYRNILFICLIGVSSGMLLEHTGLYTIMTLGGFLSAMADDALQVRTNAKLQDMFPSDKRATLISIESFTFSIIMIVLSPLAGFFFSKW